MKLICKLGHLGEFIVEPKVTDPLSVLIDLLDLKDKNTKFIFNGRTYTVSSNQTFKEIGLTRDQILFFSNQAISGK